MPLRAWASHARSQEKAGETLSSEQAGSVGTATFRTPHVDAIRFQEVSLTQHCDIETIRNQPCASASTPAFTQAGEAGCTLRFGLRLFALTANQGKCGAQAVLQD